MRRGAAPGLPAHIVVSSPCLLTFSHAANSLPAPACPLHRGKGSVQPPVVRAATDLARAAGRSTTAANRVPGSVCIAATEGRWALFGALLSRSAGVARRVGRWRRLHVANGERPFPFILYVGTAVGQSNGMTFGQGLVQC